MIRLVLFSALVLFYSDAVPIIYQPLLDSRIHGGSSADIKDHPYQISLDSNIGHVCGGSILDPNTVLTAAHCVEGPWRKSLRIRAGFSDKEQGGSVHNISKIIMHPQYRKTEYDNDIAIIKVSTPFEYSESVKPISLPTQPAPTGSAVVATGWGELLSGSYPSQLQQVKIKIVDHDECNNIYIAEGGISSQMICAGVPEGGRGICFGDSGGPLIYKGQVVGVTSWVYEGCTRMGYPGVFADVFALKNWILETLGIN